MAKNLLKTAIIAGAILAPVAGVYASSVEVTVTIGAVAEITSVEEKEASFGAKEYVVTVKTNSTKGYDLYASSNGDNWEIVRGFDGYPEGEDLKSTVKTTGNSDLKFKVVPRQ